MSKLEEAEYELTQMAHGENPGDNKLVVRFFLHPRQDMAATATANRPIFNEVEYVSINVPGDRDNEVVRPAMDMDKQRFALHYARFRQGKEQEVTGTPLKAWPLVTAAQVEELNYFKVRTVEQLANMADSNLQGMMGVMELRNRARDFLEQAKSGEALSHLRTELESRDTKISYLEGLMEQMAKRLDEAEAERRTTKAGKAA